MTELMVVETGEVVVQMTAEEASSITTQISVKLDALADNYESVMPLIRDAITRQAHAALGYNSPGAYIAERFGRGLSRLGADMRREVVRELSAAGLSTRAIAPVVGVSQKTVVKDTQVIPEVSPGVVDAEVIDDDEAPLTQEQCEELDAGDGYRGAAHTDPRLGTGRTAGRCNRAGRQDVQAEAGTSKPKRRKPITDVAADLGFDIRKNIDALLRLVGDERLAANEEQVTLALRGHLLYAAETVAAVLEQLPN
jgi:hypothetical protein